MSNNELLDKGDCPCCRPHLAPSGVARYGWSGTNRPEASPARAADALDLPLGWINHPYRLRIPTGHVSVAEPYCTRPIDEAELQALAEFGWSYVISAEQAMHWTGLRTVSVQLYPRGVRPINLKEFWLSAIQKR